MELRFSMDPVYKAEEIEAYPNAPRLPGKFRLTYESRPASLPSQNDDSRRSARMNRSTSVTSDDLFDEEEESEVDRAEEKSPFEKILSYRLDNDGNYEYFVKLVNRPYRDCKWVTEAEFTSYPHKTQSALSYRKKHPFPPSPPYYDQSYDEVDRVIAVKKKDDQNYYLVKWNALSYDECTWETNVDADSIERFEKFNTRKPSDEYKEPTTEDFTKIEKYPEVDGRTLFSYQLEGVNWLRFCWYNHHNCILADEMGLGKTVQAVTFLNYVSKNEHMPPPFLIVAPLATLYNWEREFETWTDLNAIVYVGTKAARNIIREYEFFYEKTEEEQQYYRKFDVIITNYEMIMNDTDTFAQFEWSCLVVDEAHRLKNPHSKLLRSLQQIETRHRVLLTGTPLQNTIEELQSLLEFLHPGQFSDIQNAESTSEVMELRERLRPYMLRRVKADVDKTIAAKEETIIECGMTKYQKQFYRAILESNAGFLSKGGNLKNIFMELRKVCIHPFLINGAEDRILQDFPNAQRSGEAMCEAITRASGKMILIDKLLPKLKADGHRILIFSQMTSLLDILGDYLAMKGYLFLRIDGNVRGENRQPLIDRFNAPDSGIFVFLLCTRAGGLGINLNAADTVIIFDSDWNPQNDLQAQARCHRIGQKKTVKVYRLITKNTYEQNMFEAASKKLGLGHAILDKFDKQHSKEIDMLLRKGAYHALNDVEEEAFDEEDIEEILSRSRTMVYNEAAGSTFAKANFDLNGTDSAVDINDPDFWSKILPQKEEKEEAVVEDEGRMRTRHRVTGIGSSVENGEEPNMDDGTSKDWNRSEREKLQHLLFWFGWDRWNDASRLTGLKRSVSEIKLASRAFLRKLLQTEPDLSKMTTARMLLEKALTPDFDPNFIGEDDAAAVDEDFLKQSAMIDPEFVVAVSNNSSKWLKRVEMLYYINMAVERANGKVAEIVAPPVTGSVPCGTWTSEDDRWLIYGTWKHGFGRVDLKDDELLFSWKQDDTKEEPDVKQLTPRVRKLAQGIKKFYSSENRRTDAIPAEPNAPKFKVWLKRDKSTVLQQMLHGGVPLKDNGEHDWAKFREICKFNDKTDEQMERYVLEMMDTGSNDEHHDGEHGEDDGKEDDEKTAEGSGPAVTAQRIKQRFDTLTQLRRIFIKYKDAEVEEYFSYLPRWRNVPRAWTQKLEYEFFKGIAERGWGVCADILKGPEFAGVFDGEPPTFVTSDARVMRRLNSVLEYFQANTLEALRQKEAVKPKKKKPKTNNDILDLPVIDMNPDGTPVMPLPLTSTAWITSLGHIVTDRTGFHTEKYIYPAGFKSSRLYASTLDPTHRVRYNCEIIDVGEAIPLFRVSMEDKPEVKYEGNSPTSPWTLILKRILDLRPNQPKALSISGPDIYGLAAPQVIYCIQNMEGADKCVNYVPRVFSNKQAVPKQIKRRTHPDEAPKEQRPKPAPQEVGVQNEQMLQMLQKMIAKNTSVPNPMMVPPMSNLFNGNVMMKGMNTLAAIKNQMGGILAGQAALPGQPALPGPGVPAAVQSQVPISNGLSFAGIVPSATPPQPSLGQGLLPAAVAAVAAQKNKQQQQHSQTGQDSTAVTHH